MYEAINGTTECPNCTNLSLQMEDRTDVDQVIVEYVFDKVEVKAALILAYSFVFSCCFFGNLLVIMVIVLHRRMRTITNFFLANLAFADLCVGVFCVYQNLSLYLMANWLMGDFLCRMQHFVHCLSYTASIAILTMIAIERYLAIIHPIRAKHIMTATRLKGAIAGVWVASAAYSSPRLIMYGTQNFAKGSGGDETICILKRALYNSKIYDSVNFGVCFLTPLVVISVMYARIGAELWRSGGRCVYTSSSPGTTSSSNNHPVADGVNSNGNYVHVEMKSIQGGLATQTIASSSSSSSFSNGNVVLVQENGVATGETGARECQVSSVTMQKGLGASTQKVSPMESVVAKWPRAVIGCCMATEFDKDSVLSGSFAGSVHSVHQSNGSIESLSSRRVTFNIHSHSHKHRDPLRKQAQGGPTVAILRARRKVIRMLVAVVLNFAACNLPFHARKLWQYWSPSYNGTTTFAILATPITFLVMFMNSGINPILYAFLSDNFRKSMRDVILCKLRQRQSRRQSYSRSTVKTQSQSATRPETAPK